MLGFQFPAVSLMVVPTAYINRTVTRMWLLSGGQDIRIETYRHLGKKRTKDCSLDSCDFKMPRNVKGINISFKMEGDKMNYMIDKKDGKFYEPELFDFVICFHRILKNDKRWWQF